MKNIYVGNLGYEITPEELRKMFEHGVLKHVVIPRVNGSTLGGRTIVVNEAHPKGERGQ